MTTESSPRSRFTMFTSRKDYRLKLSGNLSNGDIEEDEEEDHGTLSTRLSHNSETKSEDEIVKCHCPALGELFHLGNDELKSAGEDHGASKDGSVPLYEV